MRRLICGPNAIDVEITPIWKLLIKEVLNPFYIFQLFSVCLWFSEDYKEYALAIILMSVTSIALTVYDLRQEPPEEVVRKALDVITIAVPPALPAALTTGIIYAQRRLKKKGIFCISPQRINVCGQLNLVCFDKMLCQYEPLHSPSTNQVPAEGLAILHQFPFSSALQRMTVIVQEVGGDRLAFMKGAPERVASFCQPDTGDNLQTAITVARKSGMVSEGQKVILVEANEATGSSSASISWELVEEKKHIPFGNQDNYINITEEASDNGREGTYHFALSGKSFNVISQHFSSLLPKILINGTIFARMSPGQKSSLVEEFQKLEEGRAALVTSFCMFKYMALYSMIQYVGVLLLYWETNSLSNYQFLFQDLAITTLIGVTMNMNGANPKLVPFRPAGRLISPPLLLSVILNILLSLAMHIVGFILVQKQPWYLMELHRYHACTMRNESISAMNMSPSVPEKTRSNSTFASFENTTIWFLGTINCILVALVFSKGKPFRQPTYTNCLCEFCCLNLMMLCPR
ncbi:putative cation-transporting ATPase 13A4 [Cricetulus griseus]|uniref:Putative cation-transporting ATPase 13A4 n=1 Tax=Cricetulus griseus TaxID=10029 RepID=G3HWY5_CRIGR|nr:putative cation-transporting ATPase 13A4 [Cricetulus griseus]